MQIKVFKAGSMKEAMAAMKAELGPNAVILHSKKYKESGLFGFRNREIVEITAAVEDTPPPAQQAQPAPPPVRQIKKPAPPPAPVEPAPAVQEESAPVEIESPSDAEILNLHEENPAPPPKPVEHVTETLSPVAAPVVPPPKSEAVTETLEQTKIRQLEDELAQMKALLAGVLGKDSKKSGLSLHDALKLQEVDENILSEISAGVGDIFIDSQSNAARWMFSSYLSEHINFSDGIKLNRRGYKAIALLGTTGVGKTTTLAKIAAKFVLEQNATAAMITADTYRISAVDQLRTYSDILGLPLEVVYNPQELTAAVERHQNKDLILIDTAGRSQHNDFQMQELADFFSANPQIEKHLVISSTTKPADAKEIIKRFAAVKPEKIIITKIDETGGLGMVINLLRDEKLALSYITTGQSVPDDIEIASADVLTNIFLKKAAEWVV